MKDLPSEFKQFEQYQKIRDPDSTPEDLLAELAKTKDENVKSGIYQYLTSKISEIEDEEKAKKLIEQIPDEQRRKQVQESYESARINKMAENGTLEEAKKLISGLTKKRNQIEKLVTLAVRYQQKNTEKDHETAVALIKEAKDLIKEYPEDQDETDELMEVVKGYAVIEPAQAFRLFEPIVEQINDTTQAGALLSKYSRAYTGFKRGEVVLQARGNFWNELTIYKYIPQIGLLGKADLPRMVSFIDKFQRAGVRAIIKLHVAQGFLAEEKTKQSF